MKHVRENHPIEVNCKLCTDSFSRTCDLEVHIEAQHKVPTNFKCSKCEKIVCFKLENEKA